MMLNRKSSLKSVWLTIFAIPFLAISLAAVETPPYHQLPGAIPVYQELDVNPTFNGGDLSNFAQWVGSQLQYPEECKKDNIGGRVVLSFVVGTDGKLTEITVLRGVHEKIDAEAVRVLNMSPEWTPGYVDGKPVRVTYTIPLVFKIPESK